MIYKGIYNKSYNLIISRSKMAFYSIRVYVGDVFGFEVCILKSFEQVL